MKNIFLTTLILFIASHCFSQNKGIRFQATSLEAGMELAQATGKSIFVDAYAPWCIPCKKMEKSFGDKVVGELYNGNFINVKLNVDAPENLDTKTKYDIVFLPTVMILDSRGKVRYKVDKFLTKSDLIDIANLTADPRFYYASEATRITSSPIHQDPTATSSNSIKKEDISVGKNEKIVAMLDSDAENFPPEVMFQEAYLRLEKMDGSHRSMVRKYLQNETDWTSEKNLRFIFDFLDGTNQQTLFYYLDNRPLFSKLYSEKQIDRNARMAIHNRLYKVIPRPDKEEAILLFKNLGVSNPLAKTEKYLQVRDHIPAAEN